VTEQPTSEARCSDLRSMQEPLCIRHGTSHGASASESQPQSTAISRRLQPVRRKCVKILPAQAAQLRWPLPGGVATPSPVTVPPPRNASSQISYVELEESL
jgi:hypothetical protein